MVLAVFKFCFHKIFVKYKKKMPHFNPPIPFLAIFRKANPEFKEYLLDKFINIEMVALRGAA